MFCQVEGRLGIITVSHAAFHVAERPEQTLVVYHLPSGTGPLARGDTSS